MDRYKKLISNTVIFAIGTFSSKLLVFVLTPFYAHMLTSGELGIADLIVQTSNLLLPLVSAGIANAIIRYGLDSACDKRAVFSGGILTVFVGYLVFLACYPLLHLALQAPKLQQVQNHIWLVYLFVLTSCMRSLCSNFVRSRQLVKLYAFDGVLATVTVVLFNLLFLWIFKLGVIGYVLATICSDFISAIFLFWIARLHKYVRFSRKNLRLLGPMLRYAMPLIPTSLFWWITNVSDHFFVTSMIGPQENGLYVIAYKVPMIVTLVSSFFTDAWQLSAVTDGQRDRDRFFSTVFSAYSALIFTAASGLILLAKPVIFLLVAGAKEYVAAWQYVPFLLVAAAFSCLVTFLGSVYMVERKSVLTLITTAAGAIINIILNILLIPVFNVNGAAFATFCSYFCVFLLRMLDTRRFVRIRWKPVKVFFSLGILLAQCWVLLTITEGSTWIYYEGLLCLLMIGINLSQILQSVRRFLFRKPT